MRKFVVACDVCNYKKEIPADGNRDLGISTYRLGLGAMNYGGDCFFQTKEICNSCFEKLQKEIDEFTSKSKYFLEIPDKE